MKFPWKKWFAAPSAPPPSPETKGATAGNPTAEERMQEIDRRVGVNYGAPSLTEQNVQELLSALTDALSPAGAFRDNGVFMVGGDEFFGPFESWEEIQDYKTWWVERAPATWFPALLQAGLSLQAQEAEDEDGDDDEKKLELSSLLSEWTRKHGDVWPQIVALCDTPSGRSLALSVWSQVGPKVDAQIYQEFARWSDNLSALSEDEIVDLIDGFWSVGSEDSRRILEKISDFLPAEMQEAREELEAYKKSAGTETP